MNTEYDIPCWCAPALMRTIHSFRKSRFLFLRSRYAYFHPRSTFSFAAFQSLHEFGNSLAFAHEGRNLVAPAMMGKRARFSLPEGERLHERRRSEK